MCVESGHRRDIPTCCQDMRFFSMFLSFFLSLFTFGLGVSPPLTGAVFPTSPSNSKQVGSNTAICPGRQLRSSSRTKHSEPSGRRINEEHLLAVVEGREVQSDPDEASRSSDFTRLLDFFPIFSSSPSLPVGQTCRDCKLKSIQMRTVPYLLLWMKFQL